MADAPKTAEKATPKAPETKPGDSTPSTQSNGAGQAVPSRTKQQQNDGNKDAGRLQGDTGKEERQASKKTGASGTQVSDAVKAEQSTGATGATGGQQVVGVGADAVTVNIHLNAAFSELEAVFQRLLGNVASARDISGVLKKLDAARDELAKVVGLEKRDGVYVTHAGYAANPSLLGQTTHQAEVEKKAQTSKK